MVVAIGVEPKPKSRAVTANSPNCFIVLIFMRATRGLQYIGASAALLYGAGPTTVLDTTSTGDSRRMSKKAAPRSLVQDFEPPQVVDFPLRVVRPISSTKFFLDSPARCANIDCATQNSG